MTVGQVLGVLIILGLGVFAVWMSRRGSGGSGNGFGGDVGGDGGTAE